MSFPVRNSSSQTKKSPVVCFQTTGHNPGNDLLSHNLEMHYHRLCSVSLPCSGWERVVPLRGITRLRKSQISNLKSQIIACLAARNCKRAKMPSENCTLGENPHFVNKAKERRKKAERTLVLLSYTYYYAYTRNLSTWWSTTVLQGDFILGEAWRLDAFSAYPFQT